MFRSVGRHGRVLHLNHVVSPDVHEQTVGLRARPVEGHLLALQQLLSVMDVVLPRVKRRIRLPFLIQALDNGTQQAVLRRPALQCKPAKKQSQYTAPATTTTTIVLWLFCRTTCSSFVALTLLVVWQEGHPASKKLMKCWRGSLWSEVQMICILSS